MANILLFFISTRGTRTAAVTWLIYPNEPGRGHRLTKTKLIGCKRLSRNFPGPTGELNSVLLRSIRVIRQLRIKNRGHSHNSLIYALSFSWFDIRPRAVVSTRRDALVPNPTTGKLRRCRFRRVLPDVQAPIFDVSGQLWTQQESCGVWAPEPGTCPKGTCRRLT